MIAIDTNVLVRLLVDDEPGQTRRAVRLLERSAVLLRPTVILETAWVLQSAYGLDRSRISRALRSVLGIDSVSTDDPAAMAQALDLFDAGLDFADALHLAGAQRATTFATFDEQLVKKARRAGVRSASLVPR